MTTTVSKALTLYYDGLCILCSREMDFYKAKDPQGLIRYVDISHPDFDEEQEGLTGLNYQKYFHGRNAKGELLVGVPAFQEIWKVLNIFPLLTALSRSKMILPFFQLGYFGFIHIRPFLPRKKCETNLCHR